MKKTAIIFSVVATAFALQAADSSVTFNNNVFKGGDGNNDPAKWVKFDSTFGALAGTGVVNGAAGAGSYVAQLFSVAGGVETAVGATANFRASSTTQPGTWSGASRTLTGLAPGTAVDLVVKVWDVAAGSYAAAQAGNNLGFGKSAVFSYTQPVNVLLPSDTFMTGFGGFSITQNTTPIVPEPSTFALAALGVAGLVFLRRK